MMRGTQGWTMFDTALGGAAVAWGLRGILGIQLPEGSDLATETRIRRRFPQAQRAEAPEAVRRAIAAMVALINGERTDLSSADLDMDGVPAFNRQVYAIARSIPAGETLTYGEIAARMGDPGAARAVGRALGQNPFPIVVPCHRVVAAGGRIGGFSADGGIVTKVRLLSIERARIGAPSLFDGEISIRMPPSRARG